MENKTRILIMVLGVILILILIYAYLNNKTKITSGEAISTNTDTGIQREAGQSLVNTPCRRCIAEFEETLKYMGSPAHTSVPQVVYNINLFNQALNKLKSCI